jgi:hypothetical protein
MGCSFPDSKDFETPVVKDGAIGRSRLSVIGSQPPPQLYFDLTLDEKAKGFGIAALARFWILARSDIRCAKDRLVLVRPSRRKILFINRISAVDRKNGFPNPGCAGHVDHVQRINRRVSYRVRFVDKNTCGQSRAGNGRGALYQCSIARRLASGGALLDHLH